MKRKYVKVIAAVIGMAIMNGHPLTLNAKSKKNRTATPTGITIHGYGETASFSVDSKNLRTDEPIQVLKFLPTKFPPTVKALLP